MISREFNLYLHAGHSIPLVINVNQYDHGEQWLFSLFNSDGTQYIPSSGAIVGIKSDNLGIINSGTVDSQGRVVINETQQMTAAVGKAVFELLIDDQTHGTANFVVLVEPKPGDNADLSESDYSLFQQAIDGTSATAIAEGVADWMDENLTPTSPVVDASLTVQGAAADSAKVGQELSDLKSEISDIEEQIEGGGLTSAIKQALLQIAKKVAYIDENGQDYYDDLYDALYPPVVYTAISLNTNSLSFGSLNSTQQLSATTTPIGGEVTWSSSDTSVATVSDTGLVTSVAYGNATITATCGGLSATCSVLVAQATVTSISAVYTQGEKTVYNTDSLNTLKEDLVVTATWSNSTTSVVASEDYTLSGTLTVGTSTVTVTYAGQTTTFTVTVTEMQALYSLPETTVFNGTSTKIDTEVTPMSADSDFTILMDYTNGELGTAKTHIFYCIKEVSPYYGIDFVSNANGTNFNFQGANSGQQLPYLRASTDPTKVVIRRDSSNDTYYIDGEVNGVRQNQIVVQTTKTISSHNIHLWLGVKANRPSYTEYWTGTMRSFDLYPVLLSDDSVTAFLGV